MGGRLLEGSTMVGRTLDWKEELGRWLKPFLDRLGHKARRQDVGREKILSRQPAGKDGPAHLGGHHQSAMDLRAGSPTAERRTRSRSLRGTILAGPSPSCAHDDDRICLPPASPPFNSKAGKKESTGHRPNRLCQPCVTPSSNSS